MKREHIRKNITNILKNFRKEKKIRQVDMAKVLGMSQSNYSKVERGFLIPSILEWCSFCNYFDIPIESIIHHDDGEILNDSVPWNKCKI